MSTAKIQNQKMKMISRWAFLAVYALLLAGMAIIWSVLLNKSEILLDMKSGSIYVLCDDFAYFPDSQIVMCDGKEIKGVEGIK